MCGWPTCGAPNQSPETQRNKRCLVSRPCMTVFKIVYVWGSGMSRTGPQDVNEDVGNMFFQGEK